MSSMVGVVAVVARGGGRGNGGGRTDVGGGGGFLLVVLVDKVGLLLLLLLLVVMVMVGRGVRQALDGDAVKTGPWGGGGIGRCQELFLVHPQLIQQLLLAVHLAQPLDLC